MAPSEPVVDVTSAVGNESAPAGAMQGLAGDGGDRIANSHDETRAHATGVASATPSPIPSDATSAAARHVDGFALDLATDVLALLLSAVVGLLLLSAVSNDPNNSLNHFWVSLLHLTVLFPGFLMAFITYGLYRQTGRRIQPSVFDDLKDIGHALAAGGFLALAIVVAVHKISAFQVTVSSQLVAMGAVGMILIPASRALVANVVRWRIKGATRIAVIGTGTVAQQVARRLRATSGVSWIGFVDDHPLPGFEVIGSTAELPELCKRLRVDQVIVAFSQAHPADLTTILRPLHGRVSIALVPRYFDLVSARSRIDEIYGLPVVDVASPHLGGAARMGKRVFDIAMASIGLVLFAPLLALIAIAIKRSSQGPVLFRQTRIGQNRKAFTIFKFRTMTNGAEAERAVLRDRNHADGPLFKLRDDPRVTVVGRVLRRTSLDELPQLWNVVLGSMSLVGPRPLIAEESVQIDGWAARRFDVRPGLTGQWQVSGRNELAHNELCRLDYLYVACWSMQWDLRILWQTVGRVVSGYGAY
jgi:exopolysaccharide biosynthesis polyprenyl glycosylphosphotransferase